MMLISTSEPDNQRYGGSFSEHAPRIVTRPNGYGFPYSEEGVISRPLLVEVERVP